MNNTFINNDMLNFYLIVYIVVYKLQKKVKIKRKRYT